MYKSALDKTCQCDVLSLDIVENEIVSLSVRLDLVMLFCSNSDSRGRVIMCYTCISQ